MRAVVLCAALLAVVWPSSSNAQTVSLTEGQALARLSLESPRVRAIRASIDVARAEALAAARWPNPTAGFNRESVAGITETITTVAQILPVTGRHGLEVRAASTLLDASGDRADDAVRRARADLRRTFARLVAAQTRERELESARDRLNVLATALAAREAAGDAAGFDRLRAEREVLDLEADLAAAATARSTLQAAVVAFFAESIEPSRLVGVAVDREPAALPPVAVLVERSETTRGEVLALRKEADAARLSARAADRRRVPEPQIVAGAKSSSAAGGDLGSVISLQAVVPLFDRGQPERALAEARASLAESRLAVLRLEIASDIAALRAAVVQQRDSAQRYRTAAVAGAGEIERIARVGYDAGERTILELLDAIRLGASARLRQALLDLAVREAEIDLEYVSGWELPS